MLDYKIRTFVYENCCTEAISVNVRNGVCSQSKYLFGNLAVVKYDSPSNKKLLVSCPMKLNGKFVTSNSLQVFTDLNIRGIGL
jgi:hypothetical protein